MLQTQSQPDSFRTLLEKNSMQFAIPGGFRPVPVLQNGDVEYDYAIASENTKLEIRYRIWPIEPEELKPKQRNNLYLTMLATMALNISNGQEPKVASYPPEDVKREFGADAGATCAVRTDSEFGKGYKFCLISVIHRNDVADAYVFFLCDDPTVAMRASASDAIYHALSFR